MPDPQAPGPPSSDQSLYSPEEFAGTLRRMYPELAGERDDRALTSAVLKLYPEFKDHVQDPATLPAAPRPGTPAPPLAVGTATHIGADPGGRPLLPLPGEFGFEAGWERLKRGVRNAVYATVGQDATIRGTGKIMANPFDATVRNAADIVGGGMQAAEPALLPTAALAPIPTAVAMGVGTGVTEATKAAMEYANAPKPLTEVISDLAGVIVGGKAAHAVAEPPSTVTQPRSIPAEGRFQDAVYTAANASLEQAGDRQNLEQVQATFKANRRAAAEADAQLKATAKARVVGRMAIDAAKAMHERGTAGAGPFAYLDTLLREQVKLASAATDTGDQPPSAGVKYSSSFINAAGWEEFGPPPDLIDSFRRVPPTGPGGPPPRLQLPEHAGPSTATPQNFILGAPPEMQLDAAGAGGARIAQATPEHLFESQQLSDLIDRAQTDEDRAALMQQQTRYQAAHAEAAKDIASELEQHTYDPAGRVIETAQGVNPTTGQLDRPVVRAVGGTTVFHDIVRPVVGRNPDNAPPRALITQLAQAYADTGATSAKELPKDYLPAEVRRRMDAGRLVPEDEQAFYSSRKFKNQYDRYIKFIIGAAEDRAQNRLATAGESAEGAAGPPGLPAEGGFSPEELFSIGRGPEADRVTGTSAGAGVEPSGQDGGPPPAAFGEPPRDVSEQVAGSVPGAPPSTTQIEGEMPAGWLGLPDAEEPTSGLTRARARPMRAFDVEDAPPDAFAAPTATFLGYTDPRMSPTGEAEPQYNISGGPSDRSTVTGTAELAMRGVTEVPATPTFEEFKADPGKYRPERPSLYKRMLGEEGHLILDVRPGDLEGLKRWYRKQEKTYSDEDWYQAGISALAAGDPDSAWRVASIASARAFAAAGGGAVSRNREAEPLPGIATAQIKQSIETALGTKLPHGTTIGEGGIVKLPGNPGGLDPRYTDLVLGKNFVKDLVDLVDPSTIVRVENAEGKLPADIPKELRISYQMADQILRQMPEDLLEPFLDDTGLDRAGAAAHLARAASQAGKTLATFKQWQDAHWEEILHLNPELAGTRGPGAAGRLEFVPEERQAQILSYLEQLKKSGKATPEMRGALQDLGFELPKTIKPDTKEALTYTRRWLTKQRRLAEMGRTLDIAAASGDDFDRVAAASALGLTNERSTAGQIFDDVFGRARLSFMLSQASTSMKILESHGLRYNMGILEEALSGVAARLTGKLDKSTEHFTLAKEMGSLKPGTFPTGLLRKPWTDSLGEMFNYTLESVSGLEENDRRRALATLDSFPREEARMTGAALLGEQASPASKIPGVKWLVDPRTRNVLTVGIRAQAAAIRSGLYDATLRALIKAKGDDPGDILGAANPGQELIGRYGDQEAQSMVGAGVAAALNYTYSGRPLPDSLPGKVIDMMSSLPVVSTMLRMEWAFPRFQFATVPRWVWDRMPGSLVFDLMAKKLGNVGRLAKGAEKSALEDGLIPTQVAELNKARYASAVALQDSMASRLTARDAAEALKAHEKTVAAGGLLPDVMQSMQDASTTLQEHVQKATESARAHKAAEARVSDLLSQLKQSQGRLGQLQEIDAPSWEQALVRQAVGAGLLMPLALAMRNSKGAEDTEYYQYKIGGKPLDMRPFLAGFGPFLLYADFFSDVAKNTDWGAVQKAHEGGSGWTEAFGTGYQGKYTDRKLLADTMEAWITTKPLFGTASFLVDALSGKQAEGEGSMVHQVLDEFLATTGQAIGSFFLPAQTMSDLAGAVIPSEATSRTAERPGQYTSTASELGEPAASHIPGVRETVPERINPFTGEARTLQHPALHQLLGTTFGPEATQVEQEITHTGLKPGLALPRVSGDAEFDNRVNRAYAQVLKENFGDLLRDPEYQRLSLPHRRDVLEAVFKQLKAAAYGMVAEQVGDEVALGHLRPDQTAKVQRWQALAEKWAPERQPAESEPPEAEPAGGGAAAAPASAPAFGSPPPQP